MAWWQSSDGWLLVRRMVDEEKFAASMKKRCSVFLRKGAGVGSDVIDEEGRKEESGLEDASEGRGKTIRRCEGIAVRYERDGRRLLRHVEEMR